MQNNLSYFQNNRIMGAGGGGEACKPANGNTLNPICPEKSYYFEFLNRNKYNNAI